VPQPTYQTVPTIGYNQVSPHYTQPYSFWTDPNAFDIPPEAVSQIDPNTLPVVSVPPINNVPQVSPSFIDLNSLPSVNVPQMSAADATAAGNLLSTGLNLQTPDWNSLIKGAGAMAASQYGPMVQSIAQQAKNAANTIQGYTQGAQGVLQDTARDINQSYAQSIAAQKGLDQGIVNMMSAANPNAVQQPMLNAQGIDPTTQAQIQAQNNQSFNAGGAALGSLRARRFKTTCARFGLRSQSAGSRRSRTSPPEPAPTWRRSQPRRRRTLGRWRRIWAPPTRRRAPPTRTPSTRR
jgi:hypothetical protein